jgi:hypothetical protein
MAIAEFSTCHHFRNNHARTSLGGALSERKIGNARHGREKYAVWQRHTAYIQRLFKSSHQEMPI